MSKSIFNYKKRLTRLREKMQDAQVDALLFGGADRFDPNAFYYSGDSAFPSILLVTQDNAVIFSTLQQDELPVSFEFYEFKNWKKKANELIEKSKPTKIGLDQRSDTLGFYAFEKTTYEKINFTKYFLELREIKEPQEVELIKTAQNITKNAVAETLEQNLQGLTESQIAGKIETKAREQNASLDSFTPLVQSGEKTSVFHGATDNTKVDFSKPLLIDVGAKYEQYCADYTTVFYEGSNKEIKDAMEAVCESQKQAQRIAEKENNGKLAGQAAINVLAECGFSKYTHADVGLSLGHGVGLEVHDGHRRINEIEKLKSGMCFTVEPGLYFPHKFGVRYEDIAFI